MLNQYDPQRFRQAFLRNKPVNIGTVPVGTITRYNNQKIIVLAWFPREIGASRMVNGQWKSVRVARGGHLALVKALHNGRVFRLSDVHLIAD